MSSLQTAKRRMRQRSNLPTGDHIRTKKCSGCDTSIWCWNDDILMTDRYPYRVLCTYCKQAERAYNAAFFGKQNKLTDT